MHWYKALAGAWRHGYHRTVAVTCNDTPNNNYYDLPNYVVVLGLYTDVTLIIDYTVNAGGSLGL